jgi:hypothetical protein
MGAKSIQSIRSFFWWIYYGLFLGLCIFIFFIAIRYIRGLLFAGSLNLAQSLYGVAVAIMILGLLSMAIAYLVKNLWIKIAGNKRGI